VYVGGFFPMWSLWCVVFCCVGFSVLCCFVSCICVCNILCFVVWCWLENMFCVYLCYNVC